MIPIHKKELEITDSDIMMRTLKERLKANAEGSIPLHETENKVYSGILKIGQTLLQEYIDELDNSKISEPVTNSQGEEVPYKRTAEREYLSIFGPVKIRRAYHWKEGCLSGCCPLDQQLNLPDGKFSYALQEMALSLLVSSSYNEALEIVEKMFKIRLWPEAVQTMLSRASAYVDRFYKEEKIRGRRGGCDCCCNGL